MKRTGAIIRKAEKILERELHHVEDDLIKFFASEDYRKNFHMRIRIVQNVLFSLVHRLEDIKDPEFIDVRNLHLRRANKALSNLAKIQRLKVSKIQAARASLLLVKAKSKGIISRIFGSRAWRITKARLSKKSVSSRMVQLAGALLVVLLFANGAFAQVQLTADDARLLKADHSFIVNIAEKNYEKHNSRMNQLLKKFESESVADVLDAQREWKEEDPAMKASASLGIQKMHETRAQAYELALKVIREGGRVVVDGRNMIGYDRSGKVIPIANGIGKGSNYEYTVKELRQVTNKAERANFLLQFAK